MVAQAWATPSAKRCILEEARRAGADGRGGWWTGCQAQGGTLHGRSGSGGLSDFGQSIFAPYAEGVVLPRRFLDEEDVELDEDEEEDDMALRERLKKTSSVATSSASGSQGNQGRSVPRGRVIDMSNLLTQSTNAGACSIQ